MGLFAAGNDLVTIILALIPVAVFVFSNLYKGFAKANQNPANVGPLAKPQNGLPKPPQRVMDLEAFLREAKKQGAEQQANRPNKVQQKKQEDRSESQKNATVSPVLVERTTNQKPIPPLPPQKKRVNIPNKPLNIPQKGQKKQNQPTEGFLSVQGKQTSPVASLNALSLSLSPPRPTYSIEENPVGIALTLLRKPHGGAAAFVMQEILGQPRSRNPHRPA